MHYIYDHWNSVNEMEASMSISVVYKLSTISMDQLNQSILYADQTYYTSPNDIDYNDRAI
uniref:Uncharacterized protein n=1 Tax=Onchocerca volvulus TaxID=6282 RepID=A0A8R1TZS5_ONCVO